MTAARRTGPVSPVYLEARSESRAADLDREREERKRRVRLGEIAGSEKTDIKERSLRLDDLIRRAASERLAKLKAGMVPDDIEN
jgi:hypothetical protein